MIGEIITCENKGCEIVFAKRTHNQRYHDDECCRLATNAKIMQKYYQRRAQKLGLARDCVSCDKPLSRYNSDSVCNACSLNRQVERNQAVLSMLNGVAWQA
jgi:hypothetical protein